MVEIPRDLELKLDIVWAAIRDANERNLIFYPAMLGVTRVDCAHKLGWSYMVVHRAVKILMERGQLTCKWTHHHQSYWEAHYRTENEQTPQYIKQEPWTQVINF